GGGGGRAGRAVHVRDGKAERELVSRVVAAGVRILGWHSWRARAARITSFALPAITYTTTTTTMTAPPPAKPALSEARALLH
ncbi:unnamed protein product, partial [Laminaria digitata]